MTLTLPRIEWKSTGTDPNELVAHYGHFYLRIEKMRKGVWWYAIHQKNKELVHECDARCKKDAKNKVGKALLALFV